MEKKNNMKNLFKIKLEHQNGVNDDIVFIVNSESISHNVLVFLLLSWNKKIQTEYYNNNNFICSQIKTIYNNQLEKLREIIN